MFLRCTNLIKASAPCLEGFSSSKTNSPFYGCTALRIVDVRKYNGFLSSLFYQTPSLECVDVFGVSGSYSSSDFSASDKLKVISIRKTSKVQSLSDIPSTGNFAVDGAGGYLIVPSALIESYKSATNWSALYEAGTCTFLATEDYTVDGTLEGELDWDKIDALIGGTEE
jgi:hypothetical protein